MDSELVGWGSLKVLELATSMLFHVGYPSYAKHDLMVDLPYRIEEKSIALFAVETMVLPGGKIAEVLRMQKLAIYALVQINVDQH